MTFKTKRLLFGEVVRKDNDFTGNVRAIGLVSSRAER